jgi:hypothetical protein
MVRSRVVVATSLTLAFAWALGGSYVKAEAGAAPYPRMAPLDQYLMPDRSAEVSLARSAAPESISRDAGVMVLGPHGYETAIEGKNGFVCLVERAWMSAVDSPGFWNPKLRAPLCFNPQAVRCVLPLTLKKTQFALAGQSPAQIGESLKAAYAKRDLPGLEPGAMSYMMSKDAYLTDDGSHNLAHVMFYAPLTDKASWGADLTNSPVILLQQGPPEPFNLYIVAVGKWSDGTQAPLPH